MAQVPLFMPFPVRNVHQYTPRKNRRLAAA